jgi:hypothetical protein
VKNFSQNSLIPIQILNGFFIFYCATWEAVLNDLLISVIIFLRSFVDKEWRVVKV